MMVLPQLNRPVLFAVHPTPPFEHLMVQSPEYGQYTLVPYPESAPANSTSNLFPLACIVAPTHE